MNTLKTLHGFMVILIVSLLVGCSDQITSTSDNSTDPAAGGKIQESETKVADQVASNYFTTRIKLGPNREYLFNASNTGLAKFNAIDVERFSNEVSENLNAKDCWYLYIYGVAEKYDIALSCHSKGFDVKQIVLKNLTSKILDLEVSLLGVKIQKISKSEW